MTYLDWASVAANMDDDLAAIARSAGADVAEGNVIWSGGRCYVAGVTKAALETAKAAYDPAAAAATRESEALRAACRAECARRIFAAASATTQNNLNAYMNWLALKSGTLTNAEKADVAAFGEAFQWIAAMRATWRQLHTAGDQDFREDAKWPALPATAAALAARF